MLNWNQEQHLRHYQRQQQQQRQDASSLQQPPPTDNSNNNNNSSEMMATASATTSEEDDEEEIDYGYEYHQPSRRQHAMHRRASSRWMPTRSHQAATNIYGYENHQPSLPPPPSDVPMSPERRARKQRLRPNASRRGGACHSDLLKSAVLATLESYESGEEEHIHLGTTTGGSSVVTPTGSGSSSRRHSTMTSIDATATSMLMMDDNSRSSNHRNRKRARQQDLMDDDDIMDSALDEDNLDDCLLGAMDFCTISTRRMSAQQQQLQLQQQQQQQSATSPVTTTPEQPMIRRHVARRTSKELSYGIVPSPRTNGENCSRVVGS